MIGEGLLLLLRPLTLRKSTSNASPKLCAGSVLTINTFKSLYSYEDANSTANADEMDVLPTPPFPPTKITGVLFVVLPSSLLLFFFLLEATAAISSINGCNEYSLVDGTTVVHCDGVPTICREKGGLDGVTILRGGGSDSNELWWPILLNAQHRDDGGDVASRKRVVAMVAIMM